MYLPQFDGYHIHPVDIHSIESLRVLENIKDESIKKLYESLSEDEKAILKLTVFLHDCGKGRKGNHCEIGSQLIKSFAKSLNFDEKLVESAAKLVKIHTLMSSTSYKEDIHNQKVIFSFINRVGSIKNLTMLYILTYCDILAVDKKFYTTFSARLLKTLYYYSLESFENAELIDETAKRLRKESALKKLESFQNLSKILQNEILNIESNIFFLINSTEEIVNICKMAQECKETYCFKIENSDQLCIKIIRKQPMNLGYLLAKLSRLNLININISKLFDGIKYFQIEFNEAVEDFEVEYIKEYIKDASDMEKKVKFN